MKYYMRGIGVGILVCALILIISRINTPAEISDSEIVSRALALGMIDPGNLSLSEAAGSAASEGSVTEIDNPAGIKVIVDDQEISSDAASSENNSSDAVVPGNDEIAPSGNDGEPSVDTSENKDGEKTSADPEVKPEETAVEKSEEKNAEPAEEKPEEKPDVTPEQSNDQGKVVLEVYRGNSSDVVASRAQSIGLVDDAKDFDRYLVQNGYANRISVGSFAIEKGSDYNTIARIITNS